MSSQEIVTTGVVLVAQLLSLIAQWLQLRLQARSKCEHWYIFNEINILPADDRIQHQRPDTSRPVLIIGAPQQNEERQ